MIKKNNIEIKILIIVVRLILEPYYDFEEKTDIFETYFFSQKSSIFLTMFLCLISIHMICCLAKFLHIVYSFLFLLNIIQMIVFDLEVSIKSSIIQMYTNYFHLFYKIN